MVTGSVLDLGCKEIDVALAAGRSCKMPLYIDTSAFKFYNFASAAVLGKDSWANGISSTV